MGINPKENIIARQVIELTHDDVADEHINHYTVKTFTYP